MKKAVIIGGSNGIGLAISRNLMDQGYFVEICDRVTPEDGVLDKGSFNYHCCDLYDFDEDFFKDLSLDEDIELLMITAGIGRIADFRYHHIAEIEKFFAVNTVAIIKILRIFYDRISSKQPFYTGVMGSISGWLSSPSASVYAAAKAGVVRFIESVNIELEVEGTENRILDISPASFKGSKFFGGENDLTKMNPLVLDIVENLFDRKTRFIPQYQEIFKEVLERYNNDPHEYGLHSYNYKKESGRLDNKKRVKIGYLSGTFDLFHIGHLNLLRRAKQQCDYLIVGVHSSGKWKGKETFIPLQERKDILEACRYVDKVVDSCSEDSDAWALWKYDKLFVGSDYKGSKRFLKYEEFFEDKGVEIVYFPYTKNTSSTQLRQTVLQASNDINQKK